jgi:GNAT superfamily N-acetyltransferase
MTLRLNAKQLRDWIESIEAGGGDATALRHELEALEPEGTRVPQTRRDSRFREEEETMEERLTRRVGYIFPDSIPYEKLLDYDYRYTKNELIEQCRRAGVSVSGEKKELAAKLIAKRPSGEVYIARETTGYNEEEGHPALPRGVTYPILYKEVQAFIDDVGHITYTYWPSVGVGHVEMINVEPPYQRRGFGSKLVQFAIDDMKKKGITKVSASILSKEGASLLKALGFAFVNDLMEKKL